MRREVILNLLATLSARRKIAASIVVPCRIGSFRECANPIHRIARQVVNQVATSSPET